MIQRSDKPVGSDPQIAPLASPDEAVYAEASPDTSLRCGDPLILSSER